MRSHGRELSVYAHYYRVTGDPSGLLSKYFVRIQGRTQMLMQRRQQALQLQPTDPAYGILRGDGNEDLGATEIGCGTAHPDGKMGDCQTELPYLSITAEAYEGFSKLGPVWETIGTNLSRPDISAAGAAMTAAALPMLKDFRRAIARGATPGRAPGTVCHPGVAGWDGCSYGDVSHYQPIPHHHFVYPTLDVFGGTHNILWGGALTDEAARQFVHFWAENGGALTMESPRKNHSGMGGVCPFTQFGHGYGLLALDLVRQYEIFAFAMLAQAQTPGTWTAVECMGLDRRAPSGSLRPSGGGMGSGYVAPSQALMPTLVKWLLQFEDRHSTLWIGKALPREWLAVGAPPVSVERSPSSWGRLSFSFRATSATTIAANVSLPSRLTPAGEHHATEGSFQWPAGGLKLRFRHSSPKRRLSSVEVGSKTWSAVQINATEETVSFPTPPNDLTILQHIVATFT